MTRVDFIDGPDFNGFDELKEQSTIPDFKWASQCSLSKILTITVVPTVGVITKALIVNAACIEPIMLLGVVSVVALLLATILVIYHWEYHGANSQEKRDCPPKLGNESSGSGAA